MFLSRGYKYRIYPNPDQRRTIASWFGCCRFVWNQLLEDSAAAQVIWKLGEDLAHRTRVDVPKRTLPLAAVATSVATKRAAAATEAAV